MEAGAVGVRWQRIGAWVGLRVGWRVVKVAAGGEVDCVAGEVSCCRGWLRIRRVKLSGRLVLAVLGRTVLGGCGLWVSLCGGLRIGGVKSNWSRVWGFVWEREPLGEKGSRGGARVRLGISHGIVIS